MLTTAVRPSRTSSPVSRSRSGCLSALFWVAYCLIDLRQAGLETHQVSPALFGVDVVGKGENLLVISAVILDGDPDGDAPASHRI